MLEEHRRSRSCDWTLSDCTNLPELISYRRTLLGCNNQLNELPMDRAKRCYQSFARRACSLF